MRLPSPVIPVLLALAACRPSAPTPPMMTDPVWRLVEVEGRRVEAGPRQPVLRFMDARAYGGTTGCNDYGGRYRIDGMEIRFGEIEMTQKLCLDVEEQERAYLAALRGATRYTYSTLGGHTLVLWAGDRPVARFEGDLPPDRS